MRTESRRVIFVASMAFLALAIISPAEVFAASYQSTAFIYSSQDSQQRHFANIRVEYTFPDNGVGTLNVDVSLTYVNDAQAYLGWIEFYDIAVHLRNSPKGTDVAVSTTDSSHTRLTPGEKYARTFSVSTAQSGGYLVILTWKTVDSGGTAYGFTISPPDEITWDVGDETDPSKIPRVSYYTQPPPTSSFSVSLTITPLSPAPPTLEPGVNWSAIRYAGGQAPFTSIIYWRDGTSDDISNCGSNCPSHTYKFAGTYTITLKVTDAEGVTATDSKTIMVPPTFENVPVTSSQSSSGTGSRFSWWWIIIILGVIAFAIFRPRQRPDDTVDRPQELAQQKAQRSRTANQVIAIGVIFIIFLFGMAYLGSQPLFPRSPGGGNSGLTGNYNLCYSFVGPGGQERHCAPVQVVNGQIVSPSPFSGPLTRFRGTCPQTSVVGAWWEGSYSQNGWSGRYTCDPPANGQVGTWTLS